MKDINKLYDKSLENIFNKPFPVLPALLKYRDHYQFRVYIDKDFRYNLEKYLIHMKNNFKNQLYRQKSFLFNSQHAITDIFDEEKRYKNSLTEIVKNILKQGENGKYLNLFFVSLAKLINNLSRDIFQNDKYIYLYSEVIGDFHDIILRNQLNIFKKNNPILSKRIFKYYNNEFINFIINDQLPFFYHSSHVNLKEILFPLKEKKTNNIFKISRETYEEITDILRDSAAYLKTDSKYKQLLNNKNYKEIVNNLNNLYNIKNLDFLFRNEYVISNLLSSRVIKKEMKKLNVSLQEINYLYQKLIKAKNRYDYLHFINKYLYIYPVDEKFATINTGFNNGVNFWYDDTHQIHKKFKESTIFFLDIRDFTKITRRMSPDKITQQLHELFDPIPEIVTKHNGYIDKILGDGLMAIFGGKIDDEEHYLNAIRASIDIYSYFHRKKKDLDFSDVGIGINSGKITITQFGQATALGETVNKAARLCSSKELLIEDINLTVYRGSTQEIVDKMNDDEKKEIFKSKYNFNVHISQDGNLYNKGIVISSKTFKRLKNSLEVKSIVYKGQNYYLFYDPVLSKNILIRRVGKVKLKGLKDDIVYEIVKDIDLLMKLKDFKSDDTLDKLKKWFDVK